MAIAKSARVIAVTAVGPQTRLLELALPDGAPLGFAGGQYIIVNSGVPLPGGKIAKRAYSILSSDTQQQRITLAVRRIGEGPGSNFMHRLSVGDEVPFSGPWGQLVAPTASSASGARTLLFATDTGITAALGLIRGAAFQSQLSSADLIWVSGTDDYFVPASTVRDWLPSGLGTLKTDQTLPTGHADRLALAWSLVQPHLKGSPLNIYLSGDGALLAALREKLVAAGIAEAAIRMETFFNHLVRKAPA
jgi:ferredoxin-NADP reductase